MQDEVERGEARIVFRAPHGITYDYGCDGKIKTKTYNETPWVDVNATEIQVKSLNDVLKSHNKRTNVIWRMERFLMPENEWRIETLPRYSLRTMQADIIELANDIVERG